MFDYLRVWRTSSTGTNNLIRGSSGQNISGRTRDSDDNSEDNSDHNKGGRENSKDIYCKTNGNSEVKGSSDQNVDNSKQIHMLPRCVVDEQLLGAAHPTNKVNNQHFNNVNSLREEKAPANHVRERSKTCNNSLWKLLSLSVGISWFRITKVNEFGNCSGPDDTFSIDKKHFKTHEHFDPPFSKGNFQITNLHRAGSLNNHDMQASFNQQGRNHTLNCVPRNPTDGLPICRCNSLYNYRTTDDTDLCNRGVTINCRGRKTRRPLSYQIPIYTKDLGNTPATNRRITHEEIELTLNSGSSNRYCYQGNRSNAVKHSSIISRQSLHQSRKTLSPRYSSMYIGIPPPTPTLRHTSYESCQPHHWRLSEY